MTLLEVETGRIVVLLSLPTEDPVRFCYLGDATLRAMSLVQFTCNGWFVALSS